MKKLFTLFALVFATSFATAQELTPEMLVGEYEGEVNIRFEDPDYLSKDKKQKLTISKNDDSDSLQFVLTASDDKHIAYLVIDGENITITNSINRKFDDGDTERTIIQNYSGEKVTSVNPGKFETTKGILKLSFSMVSKFEGSFNETVNKYYYIEMKKK